MGNMEVRNVVNQTVKDSTPTRPKIKSCKDCIDPENNPGYHLVESDVDVGYWIPQPVHNELDPEQFAQPLYLDVGAGKYSQLEGWTAVDLYTEADINATMWDIPLPDGSVKGIMSQNALEHVQKSNVVPTLQEWNRLLEVGGQLELMVPDLEWACQWFLYRPTNQWDMDIIYGNQQHQGEFHLTGFTRDILAQYFKESVEDRKTKWYIESIEYLFGEMTSEEIEPGKHHQDVTQRVILLKANKI